MPSPETAPGRSSRGLRTRVALLTTAEDGQVPDVHDEAVVAAQRLAQRREHLWVNRDDAVTIPADQVEVLPLAHRVVRRGPVVEVRVPDQAELLEHLQGPVDRRDVDRRRTRPDVPEHLVGGGVAELLDGAEDQLALRREPVAALSQPLAPVLGHEVIVTQPRRGVRPDGSVGQARLRRAHRCGWSGWSIAAMSKA